MAHISTRVTQFSYFDQALGKPSWAGRKVLDFGGNVAGFLVDAGDRVDHRDYWCMDVDREALAQGRRRFPRAHFVHFDRYSPEYNPDGVQGLPIPDCGLSFDFILAFSVFTHTHQVEMLELVGQLRRLLTPDGRLAFTFTDPNYDRSLSDPALPPGSDVRKNALNRVPRNRSVDVDEIVDRACRSRWCALVDGELHVEPDESFSHPVRRGRPGESYCTYFAKDYMKELLPAAEVLDPIPPEWQHCCVLPPP